MSECKIRQAQPASEAASAHLTATIPVRMCKIDPVILSVRVRRPLPTVTSVTSVTNTFEAAPQASSIDAIVEKRNCNNCNKCNNELLVMHNKKTLPFFTATSATSATLPPHPSPQARSQMLHSLKIATNCNKLQHSLLPDWNSTNRCQHYQLQSKS
jgi:hypothetical protein